MRIGVAATPHVAIPTLEWLVTSPHDIALIITQPDRPSGRGQGISQSPVSKWADEHGMQIIKPNSPNDLVGVIDSLDVVITIGYGVLLPESVLKLPRYGFLNLHFSLLPLYRGAAPAQRALQNGETVTGVSVFQLDQGMDTGPLFTQLKLDIESEWRTYELLEQLSLIGPVAVAQALIMIEDGLSPVEQTGLASMAPKISKAEAEIDWSQSCELIINKVRAFYPTPSAWTLWKGNPLKVTRIMKSYSELALSPGQIHCADNKVLIGTGNGEVVELLMIVPAGKSEMSAIAWSRGAHLLGGEHFG